MKMRCIAAGGLLLVCAALPVVAQAPTVIDEVLTMRVEGTIDVDAQGKVVAHTISTELNPKLRALLDRNIPTWKFDAPKVDDKPAALRTNLHITLVGREIAEGYEVRVDNALFSDPSWKEGYLAEAPTQRQGPLTLVRRTPLPKFPNWNVGGDVMVAFRFNPDGTVADAQATQCSLYFAGGSETQKAAACKDMATNATRALRNWKVKIDVHGRDPRPDELMAMQPIRYLSPSMRGTVATSTKPGNWRRESRTRYMEPAWLAKERLVQRVGTADLVADGGLMSSISPLHLDPESIGGVL